MATTALPEDLHPWPTPWEKPTPCVRCGIDRTPWPPGIRFLGGKCPDCWDVEWQMIHDWRTEGRPWLWIAVELGRGNQDSLEIYYNAWLRRQPEGWLDDAGDAS